MSKISQWTNQDLAQLTEQAMQQAVDSAQFVWDMYVDFDHYCKFCTIVPVGEGMVYCDDCAQSITDYLFSIYTEHGTIDNDAQAWQEQQAVDGGLY